MNEVGSKYENVAAKFLESQGYHILKQNYRCRQGEIDIIAREGKYLCFIEVKYRKNLNCGTPLEAVTPAKQKKISRTALYYLFENGYGEEIPCRFDVVGITSNQIELVQNAFYYQR